MTVHAFVLIAMFHVYGGTQLSMQEFGSQAACRAAAAQSNWRLSVVSRWV
jgi:hypothetical protein